MYFYGTYSYCLDDKSRLPLPPKFREELGKTVFVTKGYDTCLYLYTEKVFLKKMESYKEYDELEEDERKNARLFFGSTNDYKVDGAGRITLTKDHLNRAGISKDVIIVGNFDHFEIWDRNKYLKEDDKSNNNFEKNAQKIAARRKNTSHV